MSDEKTNLLGLTKAELEAFARSVGTQGYRGSQIYRWLYSEGVSDFARMTDLDKGFRAQLGAAAMVQGVEPLFCRTSSADGTMKFLFGLHDGLKIESVLICSGSTFDARRSSTAEGEKRHTLCISTQVGCPLDCHFCATATMGFARNLSTGEILDQVLSIIRETGKKVTNVVFMGMGEPLMNYDNVMKAAEILVDAVGVAARKITVSTAGWADHIRRMADEKRRFKLAISLHSAIDATRTSLMPVAKRYSIRVLSDAVEYYYRKTRRRVTFEQIFFDEINDSENEIRALMKFVRRVPCHVNVIPFHPIDLTGPTGYPPTLRPSRRTPEIVERLRESKIPVFVRSSAGKDLDAACGQLAARVARTPYEVFPAPALA